MATDMETILRQMSNENTAKTFAYNSEEAEKSRGWQEYMSNTSHQRQVEDLKLAGLNPVLSANSGASSYSASSASGSADSSAVGALSSIYQTKMSNENAKKIAQMEIKQKQADNKNALQIAKINAAASNYSANMSASASKYASDTSYTASQYTADTSASASRYKTDMQPHAQASKMIDDFLKNKSSSAKKRAKGGYVVGSGILKTIAGVGSAVLPALLRRKK